MPTIPYDPGQDALFHPEYRPTLFVAGVDLTDVQLAIECARLAYVRAEDGGVAEASLVAALAAAGFGPHTWFDDARTGTQGFGAVRADGKAVLAFRGTQSDDFHDLLTDVEAASVPWPEARGNVHDGFAAGMRAVLTDVETWVRALPSSTDRLIVCGHSLGAALATLAASIFHPGMLITIGSPRVGDAEFVKSLGATSVVRIVDCCDLVTHLPPESPDYTHVGNLVYVDRRGVASQAPDQSMVFADQIRARLEYGMTGLRSDMAPSRDLADHAPINYCRAFF